MFVNFVKEGWSLEFLKSHESPGRKMDLPEKDQRRSKFSDKLNSITSVSLGLFK